VSKTAVRETKPQQDRVAELQDENGWPRLYTYPVQGKTIIGQFRRYVTRQDAQCIEPALYDFLMSVCGFIAEYGLVPPDGGFRSKWAEPASLLEELANGGRAQRDYGRVERVYTDGMTDVEVLKEIDELADEHRAACEEGRTQRAFERDISIAVKLLEPYHFTIVPPGWTLTDTPDTSTCDGYPTGSLAHALVQLAAANGLALIAPPSVEANGQTRRCCPPRAPVSLAARGRRLLARRGRCCVRRSPRAR
jgi:hypothetical protein